MAQIFGPDKRLHDDITIGQVGLGLIGGSMAKATKKHTFHRVEAYDLDPQTMKEALESGTIDAELRPETLSKCRLIMIAIKPSALVKWVEENANHFGRDTILVDLCGVKGYVNEKIKPLAERYGFEYVGGHPMAGKEVSGFTNSNADLFRDASMILCPELTTKDETLDTLKNFYLSLGFEEIVYSTPEEHDSIISYTSQLAHITSSAYIMSPTSRNRMGFTAGSYKDMTRVARLDPDMWTELFLDNADNLEFEVEELVNNLTEYMNALKNRDAEQLHALLEKGRDLKVTEPIENC